MPFTTETARAAGKKGGRSRARAFTREYQQAAAKARAAKYKDTTKLREWGILGGTAMRTKYTPEEFAAWGKLGAKAVIAKYGEDHYLAMRVKSAEGRKKMKPNKLERQVINVLKRLGIAHERERVMIFGMEIFTLDLVIDLPSGAKGAIQVHGEWWHNKAYKRNQCARQTALIRQKGWALLILWERATTEPEALAATLQEWYNTATEQTLWIVGDPIEHNNTKGRQTQ